MPSCESTKCMDKLAYLQSRCIIFKHWMDKLFARTRCVDIRADARTVILACQRYERSDVRLCFSLQVPFCPFHILNDCSRCLFFRKNGACVRPDLRLVVFCAKDRNPFASQDGSCVMNTIRFDNRTTLRYHLAASVSMPQWHIHIDVVWAGRDEIKGLKSLPSRFRPPTHSQKNEFWKTTCTTFFLSIVAVAHSLLTPPPPTSSHCPTSVQLPATPPPSADIFRPWPTRLNAARDLTRPISSKISYA